MKKMVFLSFLIAQGFVALACDECEKQQPKILKGIAHGAGLQSQWDYVIVWAAVIVAAVTFFYAVKWLVKPGEKKSGPY